MPVAVPLSASSGIHGTRTGGVSRDKVRATDADLLTSRSVYPGNWRVIKDYLKYDEVPGVTNCH